jgi:flagellar basal-body rod protein FlgB
MMISELTNGGGIAALELTMRFAGQRQRLIASNIANIDTPDYVTLDASPREFQRLLADALEKRDAGGVAGAAGGVGGIGAAGLPWKESRSFVRDERGELRIRPTDPGQGVLFHDRNNRDLERLMQANVENALTFRVASDLLRSRYDILRTAISQRV